MKPWTADELARVLRHMGADCSPREWARRSGLSEAHVRLALGIACRDLREALGWTHGMVASRAGVARSTVAHVEAGLHYPQAARTIHYELVAEIEARPAGWALLDALTEESA